MYNLEEFFNNYSYNVRFEVAEHDIDSNERFGKYVSMFEENVTFDNCTRIQPPVYVYELNGRPVAWYNFETMCGYIKHE